MLLRNGCSLSKSKLSIPDGCFFLEVLMTVNSSLSNVLDQVGLVVFQTRIVTPIRDTGEGKKCGSRIEKVLQSCFDPTALRPLTRMKQEATRICRNFGTKIETLNAWAVPVGRMQELLDQLAKIASEWSEFAEDLSRNMRSRVDTWAAQNPSERAAILGLAPTGQEVQETTKFIYTSFRLRPEDVDDNGCLEADLKGLAGQTLCEMAVALRDSSMDKASGSQYRQGVKDVLGRLAVKAQSLAFLDPRIEEVASVLSSTISILPARGVISDAHAVLVKSVVDQMLDPRKLMRNGFARIEQVVSKENTQPGRKRKSVPVNQADEKTKLTPSVFPERQSSAMLSQAFSW
jgi:hypothetical protein